MFLLFKRLHVRLDNLLIIDLILKFRYLENYFKIYMYCIELYIHWLILKKN